MDPCCKTQGLVRIPVQLHSRLGIWFGELGGEGQLQSLECVTGGEEGLGQV